jgi:pimeloyl-ACP methyl ester carboxylesterase
LCLAADHDGNAPPAVLQRMAQRIPRGKYLELRAAVHLANIEPPRPFNAAAIGFLQRHFFSR